MIKYRIFVFILILFGYRDASGDNECFSDSMHHSSYVEMERFIKLDGALRKVIARALMEDLGSYKINCENILNDGIRIKENYMRDLECTAKKEISENGNMDIDKFLAILKYWCGFNDNLKNGNPNLMSMDKRNHQVNFLAFFKIDTLQCLRETKTEFDNCVGYFAHKSKFSRRDYCRYNNKIVHK
jgi:hypothetical protein